MREQVVVEKHVMPGPTCAQIMNRNHPTVTPETPLDSLRSVFRRSHASFVPVCDQDGRLIGSYRLSDLHAGRAPESVPYRQSLGNPVGEIAVGRAGEAFQEVRARCTSVLMQGVIIVDEDSSVVGVIDVGRGQPLQRRF